MMRQRCVCNSECVSDRENQRTLRKLEYTEKITNLSQVTDVLYHIMCVEYTTPEPDSKSQLQW